VLIALIRAWRNARTGTRTRCSIIHQGVSSEAPERGLESNQMPKQKTSLSASRHHVSMFHHVDMAMVSPLIRSTNFDHGLIEECVNRGFVTSKLSEPLTVVKFLSRTVLAAQFAQRKYGVPASFLISFGLYKSGWEATGLIHDVERAIEWPGCDCCYSPGIREWFVKTAKLLAKSRKYRNALPLAHDVKAYAEKLLALGFFEDVNDMQDILDPIERYDLAKCDLAALRQPGEYRASEFEAYRDKSGAISFVNPLVKAMVGFKKETLAEGMARQHHAFLNPIADRIGITPVELAEWLGGNHKNQRVLKLIAAEENRKAERRAATTNETATTSEAV
jgi:hypothetical protein